MTWLVASCTRRAKGLTSQSSRLLMGKQLYDSLYAQGYHSNLQLTHATFLVYEMLDRRNFPNYTIETILDIGCSHGKAVQQLWEGGRNASGVDISSVAIGVALASRVKRAAKHGIAARCVSNTPCFQQASASSLPFRDRLFDAVLSTDVLEHVEPHEVKLVVHEIARVAKSLLFLKIASRPSTEGTDSELNQLKRKGLPVPDNLHLTLQPPTFWLHEFAQVGFHLHHRLEEHMTWITKFPHMCCAFILKRIAG